MPARSSRAMRRVAALAIGIAALVPALATTAGAATTAAPPNDAQAAAQAIHALPATLDGTLVGATQEAAEPGSECGSTAGSVWYSIRASSAQRIAADLSAAGALEATVEVYHVVRSQLNHVACDRTDAKGKAALSFKASQNGLYLIRVAALQNSQLASFALTVFLPTPAVRPPGAPLPAGGVNGQVDPIQNVNAAYAVTLHAGVSYLLNLSHRGEGCVTGKLFAPGTRSFEEGSPVLHVFCGGYRLFTPGPGQGGRYSFEVTPGGGRGVHRFRFQLARADSSETAPGLPLGNYAQGHGHLSGTGVHVLRLYRMTVTSHSNLTLKLKAPDSAGFNLQLRSFDGHVIECQCGDSGSQTLQRQVKPGRYYAVVSVHDASSGSFTLTRESRTITTTRLSFSAANVHAGESVGIHVKVSPAASGRATVQIERFDPVFGWQFYRQSEAAVRGGAASVGFVAPSVGRWRVKASYGGSRTASPSAVGYSYLTVA
ncbi:MAG TPA: hypothetical protein VL988_00410 [Solirubrobacteraceae bacterium]|nr:hypothetical protein [Solirubrobacteraceae bacterium]